MYPELITLDLPILGSVTITSFGVMMALSFLTGFWIVRVELRRKGMDEDLAGDVLMGAIIGGIVGAKIYYVLLNWPQTVQDPFGMLFSRAGLVWYGGFIGGAIGVIVAIRRRGAAVPVLADICAPALALAYAVGRMGCFLVGDDYGRPTESWVGIAFPNGSPPSTAGNLRRMFGVDVPASIPDSAVLAVHPTQLYEIGMSLLIFAILWRLRREPWQAGRLFALWLALAGVERLVVEFFRAKDDRFFGFLTLAQLISVGLILFGGWLFVRLKGPSVGESSPGT
ncbi:MAG: prolipoprotein diacylglyceryl transferase [marine benthic group bacterium]|mgnify:CR=1 FL=1|jgi:phosphatidylglycerol:prolipoprotein diacylglycerol transferase|nr:prolipoprotein diacylglyceryl transferase [Gemmatimonadota bacterium]MCL7963209.1 prolipoprotein diacylglyceryl transferase [Candidatus Carthagonibacter metallireducens]MCL7938447.1 prolipoprotein diacylglyceryl transferase [Gemmatimonadota bacterium]MCL7956574.1 prolipoprotein diacylglyceryl transferase [Gemmatimonadota bacterium]MCL7965430.1 prolipoprotein diacylglyceryl transferase [Gemmatimonadota bacterium]